MCPPPCFNAASLGDLSKRPFEPFEKRPARGPFAQIRLRIDMPESTDIFKARAPRPGKQARAFHRNVRVVFAGDDHRRDGKPFQRNRGEVANDFHRIRIRRSDQESSADKGTFFSEKPFDSRHRTQAVRNENRVRLQFGDVAGQPFHPILLFRMFPVFLDDAFRVREALFPKALPMFRSRIVEARDNQMVHRPNIADNRLENIRFF